MAMTRLAFCRRHARACQKQNAWHGANRAGHDGENQADCGGCARNRFAASSVAVTIF
jgi:hypothetical protein